VAPKSSLRAYKRITKERGVPFFMEVGSLSERLIRHEVELDQLLIRVLQPSRVATCLTGERPNI
jgi:hypothetical protein